MDAQTHAALRGLRSRGELDVVIKSLLDDCRLRTLQHIQNYINQLIKGWRGRQVRRAVQQTRSQLMEYTFIAVGSQSLDLRPTDVVLMKDCVIFKCAFKCKHEMNYNGLSLANDTGYNFGRQPQTRYVYLRPGDNFDEQFILKEI